MAAMTVFQPGGSWTGWWRAALTALAVATFGAAALTVFAPGAVGAQGGYEIDGPPAVDAHTGGWFTVEGPGAGITLVELYNTCGPGGFGGIGVVGDPFPLAFVGTDWPQDCLLTAYVDGAVVATKRVRALAPADDAVAGQQSGEVQDAEESTGGFNQWRTIFDNVPPQMAWLGWQVAIWLFPILVAGLLMGRGVKGYWPGIGATGTMAFCIWASDMSGWMFLALIVPVASIWVIAHLGGK